MQSSPPLGLKGEGGARPPPHAFRTRSTATRMCRRGKRSMNDMEQRGPTANELSVPQQPLHSDHSPQEHANDGRSASTRRSEGVSTAPSTQSVCHCRSIEEGDRESRHSCETRHYCCHEEKQMAARHSAERGLLMGTSDSSCKLPCTTFYSLQDSDRAHTPLMENLPRRHSSAYGTLSADVERRGLPSSSHLVFF